MSDHPEEATGKLAPLGKGALASLRFDRLDVFDYVRSLHEALWAFAYAASPGVSGSLEDILPGALAKARTREADARRAALEEVEEALNNYSFQVDGKPLGAVVRALLDAKETGR